MNPVRAWYTLLVAALVIVTLGACESTPMQPRESLGSTYVAIESVAILAESLSRQGAISDTERAEIKARLQAALDAMALAEAAFDAGNTAEAGDRLAQVEAALTVLRDALQEATQ